MPQAASHTHRLRTEMGCSSGSTCGGTAAGAFGNEWQLPAAQVKVNDPSMPVFGSVSGAGWAADPVDGVSPINYSLSDTGAGVSAARFYVDGIQYAQNSVTCVVGKYVPCPLTSTGSFALDTTHLSEGDHTIAVVGVDGAANATAQADKQLTITVRRPPATSGTTPVTTTNPGWNGGGSPAVGDTLAGTAGNWSGNGNTYTYQWQRCDAQGLNCVPIGGATGLGYTPGAGDVGHALVFCVTATNSGGSATSCSAPTPAVAAAHPTQSEPTDRPGDATPATPGGGGSPAPSHSTPGSGTASAPDRGAANGTPAAEKVVLTAITSSRSSTQKVKYGKRVAISGRLVGPNGAPIGGALLSVQVQTAVPGASMADAAQVTTGADGRFSYLAPVGPSRVVRFGYRTYSGDTSFADTTDVRLLVSAGVTMKATPKKVRNKHATVFTGHLLGKPIAKRGVIVDLQVFFRKHWRTFAAPRTTKAGAYKFKYRFMAGSATWKFRARVRKESSYPYELGVSAKQVKVKVTR
jgi:hypothetical protein